MTNFTDFKVVESEVTEDNAAFEALQNIVSLLEDRIRNFKGGPEFNDSTLRALHSLSAKFAASLDAAYTNRLFVDWNPGSRKESFLWLIAVSLVVDSETKDNRYLRFLYAEKLPKQLRSLDLSLFTRLADWKYADPKYLSDHTIHLVLKSYEKLIRDRLIEITYYRRPKKPHRKRGYTDGQGGLELTTDPLMGEREFRKSWESREIQEEIDRLRSTIKQAEKFLIVLGGHDETDDVI